MFSVSTEFPTKLLAVSVQQVPQTATRVRPSDWTLAGKLSKSSEAVPTSFSTSVKTLTIAGNVMPRYIMSLKRKSNHSSGSFVPLKEVGDGKRACPRSVKSGSAAIAKASSSATMRSRSCDNGKDG